MSIDNSLIFKGFEQERLDRQRSTPEGACLRHKGRNLPVWSGDSKTIYQIYPSAALNDWRQRSLGVRPLESRSFGDAISLIYVKTEIGHSAPICKMSENVIQTPDRHT